MEKCDPVSVPNRDCPAWSCRQPACRQLLALVWLSSGSRMDGTAGLGDTARPGPLTGICAVCPDGQVECLSEAPPRQPCHTAGVLHTGHWTKQAFAGRLGQWRK